MSESSQFNLENPPSDGISSLNFAPTHNNLLLSTSWDQQVRIYNTKTNSLEAKYSHEGAVLDGCWLNNSLCFSAGLDGTIKMFDLEHNKESKVGQHDSAVKSLLYSSKSDLLFSGSWDKTIKVWDLKNSSKPVTSFELPGKCYAMAMTPDNLNLIVGTSGRNVYVYDLKSLKLTQKRESSLKHQTRCIKCFVDNSGYALGSIEGRVAMEYLDPDEKVQEKKYAFKCHRSKEEGGEILYPVNAIAFHPFGTFATGGSDKIVNIWDGFQKKRLVSFTPYPTSISSLSFNNNGTQLAIASSYCFEKGEQEHPKDQIFIRNIIEKIVKPK